MARIHRRTMQKYTEERYKKDLHDPDNHDDVLTHLEPDILKWKKKEKDQEVSL